MRSCHIPNIPARKAWCQDQIQIGVSNGRKRLPGEFFPDFISPMVSQNLVVTLPVRDRAGYRDLDCDLKLLVLGMTVWLA